MSTIRIISGSYRNKPVKNEVFTLVKGYQTGKKGGFVTVQNDGQFNIDIEQVRVNVNGMQDIQFLNGDKMVANETVVVENKESEKEAMDRIGSTRPNKKKR